MCGWVCISVSVYIYTCICVCLCVCVCMCVCMGMWHYMFGWVDDFSRELLLRIPSTI